MRMSIHTYNLVLQQYVYACYVYYILKRYVSSCYRFHDV